MALWAGQGHRLARSVAAGELVALLATELDAAREAMAAGSAS
jgi:nitronate monooxygenase